MMRLEKAVVRGCLSLFLSGFVLGGASIALAQEKTADAAATAKSKYGVVDMQAVILAVDEGKEARATLEKEIKSKEGDLQKRKDELDKMNKEWEGQAAVLSDAAKVTKQKEFQEKFLALKNSEMEFQADIKRKEQKATQKIAVKVAGMVEKMAADKGLAAVFEANTSGLLYLENPTDLTKDVIAAYNKAGAAPKK